MTIISLISNITIQKSTSNQFIKNKDANVLSFSSNSNAQKSTLLCTLGSNSQFKGLP